MYLSASHFDFLNHNPPIEVFKTTDGGENWNRLYVIDRGVPKRFITNITVDPGNSEEVYITLSGFDSPGQEGHVFKSTNGGVSWDNISGNLPPTAPVSDFAVYYTGLGPTDKNYAVGTDVGVFVSSDQGQNWGVLAEGLPNSIVHDIELHDLSGYLRTATFGRGVWDVDLGIPFYLKGDYVLRSEQNPVIIERDIIVTSGGKLIIPNSCLIRVKEGKKIIVEDGGEIDAISGNPITISSESGTWNGIEFHGSAKGSLNDITFENTNTPVKITSGVYEPSESITIENCLFQGVTGPIQINNRGIVIINNCSWEYNSQEVPFVCGVESNNSSDIQVLYSKFNLPGDDLAKVAMSFTYGDNIVISNNEIKNIRTGLLINNCSPFVNRNTITYTSLYHVAGMSLNNSYTANIKENTITGYDTAIYLNNSSPVMYNNTCTYDGNITQNEPNGLLMAVYNSSPRLKPTYQGGEVIWDGGLNNLRINDNQNYNGGTGIYIENNSIPDIDFGYNTIFGKNFYIRGTIQTEPGPILIYYALYNCWVDNPPIANKFFITDATVNYVPYTCDPPGGGGENEIKSEYPDLPDGENIPPPPPIIINYGHGVFDTIRVTTGSVQVPTDQQLYMLAVKNELLGNYNSAITTYQQIIQQYQDSVTAINSLRKLLYCRDKMNRDTVAYTNLRNYYLGVAQSNQQDTAFYRVAEELAAKTLVRLTQYSGAITEYEGIINNSNDTLQILCSELNIIETYMIMQGGGNAPSFTGKLSYLKPNSVEDGIRMIMEKLHKIKYKNESQLLPKEFNLSQNYPNPFNAQTKINYSLPKATKVTIKIYDILGRFVKELVNDFKPAGYYTVTFDAINCASGVYFYRIEAGDFVQSKKMVFLK